MEMDDYDYSQTEDKDSVVSMPVNKKRNTLNFNKGRSSLLRSSEVKNPNYEEEK